MLPAKAQGARTPHGEGELTDGQVLWPAPSTRHTSVPGLGGDEGRVRLDWGAIYPARAVGFFFAAGEESVGLDQDSGSPGGHRTGNFESPNNQTNATDVDSPLQTNVYDHNGAEDSQWAMAEAAAMADEALSAWSVEVKCSRM